MRCPAESQIFCSAVLISSHLTFKTTKQWENGDERMFPYYRYVCEFVKVCCSRIPQLIHLRAATVRLGWHHNNSPPAGLISRQPIAANASRPPSLSVFMSSVIRSRCSGSRRTCCSCPHHTGLEQWAWWNVSSSDITDRDRMICHYVKGT